MNRPDEIEEILHYLQNLNEKTEAFIASTLQFHELEEEPEFNILPIEESEKTASCWEVMQCMQTDCPCYDSQDYRCWLAVGTLCGGRPQGVFAKKFKSCYTCKVFRQFTDTTARSLNENIGIIIKHLTDKANQVRKLAIKDNLTGLYNRNYLNLIEEREIKKADRSTSPLSIIIFDLDKFKIVNDNYGHLIGDEILKVFSAFLQKYTRGDDLLFRLGGDEFLLLMNGADEQQCEIIEKRFLDAFDEWNEIRKGIIPMPISYSLGGATAFNPLNLDELIVGADKGMYAHKKANQD